jgi:hypothetical protein
MSPLAAYKTGHKTVGADAFRSRTEAELAALKEQTSAMSPLAAYNTGVKADGADAFQISY